MTRLRVDGADISKWQDRPLDFVKFKKAGGKFVWIKATEGATLVDPRYGERRGQTYAAKVPAGAYHMASPEGGDAGDEFDWFYEHARPVPGDLFPGLDLEQNPADLTWEELTDWADRWVTRCKRKVQVKPVIYTSWPLLSDFGCMLWQPRYNRWNTPPGERSPAGALTPIAGTWNRVDIHQFSNGIDGVPNEVDGLGHVDLNHMRDGLTVADFTIPHPEPTGPTPVSIQRAKFTALIAESRAVVSPKAEATRAAYDAIEAIVDDSPER